MIFLAIVNQAAEQTLGMVYDVPSSAPECLIGIVSIRHYPLMGYVIWKEVFEPEGVRLAARPGVLPVSIQAMDRNDTDKEM